MATTKQISKNNWH